MQIALEVSREVGRDDAVEFLKSQLDARLESVACPIHGRGPKESAYWFSQVIAQNSLPVFV